MKDSIYQRCFQWLAASERELHPVRAFKLHSLLFTFIISQLVMLLFAFLGPRYVPTPLMQWAPWACILLAWAGLLVYRWRQDIFLSANFFILAITCYIYAFCWVMDGFRQTTYAWFGLVPLLSGLLMNRLWAVIWSFVILFAVGFGHWAAHTGMAVDLLSDQGHTMLTLIQQASFIVCLGLITNFILRQQKISSTYLREKIVSKQNLLRILVHDITTPLSIMRLTGQLLGQGHAMSPQETGLKIDRNVARINDIIGLIRDLERWEAHHVRVPTKALDLVSILDQVIELYGNRLNAKQIQIAKFYASEVHVLGHETMLIHQVFGNLVSNAIKFSPSGGKIDIAIDPLSAHTVKVVVRDYGIGMPKSIRDELFDPLVNTQRAGTLGEQGTGFGLPITKNCVELIQGTIEVYSRTREESPQDFGTSISVYLRRTSP
jgi:signal transduction histidine kinase